MNYLSVGDMALQFRLRQHNVSLKQEMSTLSKELMTGVHSDIGKALGGDMSALASINKQLRALQSYDTAVSEAATLTSSMQSSLEVIQALTGDDGVSLLSAATTTNSIIIDATAKDAAAKFQTLVATLNTNVAGRYIFSGAASDTRPLSSASDILLELQTLVASETTASGVMAVVDDWFAAAPGAGGFLDTAYAGSLTALGPVMTSDGETTEITASAASPEIRQTLKGFALSALISDGLFSSDLVEKASLARLSGETIVAAQTGLADLRADLGTSEALIEDAKARNTAETHSLELARLSMIGVDEFDTASALNALQTQLETLYTLTARMTDLSLVDYI